MPKTFATKEEKNQYERERRAAKRLKKQEAEVIVAPPVNVTPEPVAPQVKTQAELDEAERIRKLKYETPWDFYDKETAAERDARRKPYFEDIWNDHPQVPAGMTVAEFGDEDTKKLPHETKEEAYARWYLWMQSIAEQGAVLDIKRIMRRPPVPLEEQFVPIPKFRYANTKQDTMAIVAEQAAISEEIRVAYAHNERAAQLRRERCELIPDTLGPASPKPTTRPDGAPYEKGFPAWNEENQRYFHSRAEWESFQAREPWEIESRKNNLTTGQ